MQWILLRVLVAIGVAAGCVHRDYGRGGTVCVCDSNYCDYYKPLDFSTLLPEQYVLYTSTKDGERLNQTIKNFNKNSEPGVILTINLEVKYQEMIGFGGAMTDSAGLAINSLPQKVQDHLLRSYFGIDGSTYTFIRVPIGGADFSTRFYTLDDNEGDSNLEKFALSQEDLEYKIPNIKRAMDISTSNLKLFGAAWFSPRWMNKNGSRYLRPEYYNTWAKYHLRFLEEYGKHNLSFWAISTGNEPLMAEILPTFVEWDPKTQGLWVEKDFGPMLKNSQFNQTLLLVFDDNRNGLPWWLNEMFSNSASEQYIDGIALHWYNDNIFPVSLLDETHKKYPNKFMLATEACEGVGFGIFVDHVILGSWERGEDYAHSIIEDLNHWVSGWVDWNLALDETGGPNFIHNFVDSPIIVNATAGEFYKQPMFYALSHFSKFVPPGSVHVQMEGTNKELQGVAFVTPDGYLVVVVLNTNVNNQPISLQESPERVANFVAPAKSIVTFISRVGKALAS